MVRAVTVPPLSPSAAVMASSVRCSVSNVAAAGAVFVPLQAANTSSRELQRDSISVQATARAAPFKLCAARNTVSTISRCLSGASVFSSSSKPVAIACTCSAASTLKVARSSWRNLSFLVLIALCYTL